MKILISILCWFIPFKQLRKRLKLKYVKSKRIIYRNNNKVIVHMPDGRTIINPYSVPGLKICFAGNNSVVELFYPIKFKNCKFNLMSDDTITIHSSCGIYNTIIDAYNKSSVFIDQGAGIGGMHVHMANETETELRIGKDAVLSYDIEIYTTDTHPIFDMDGNCINNKKSCVTIGKHAWICASCVLLKGARIPNDVILGHSTVCAGPLTETNCIYAGNPCKCIKRNITFHGNKID